MEKIEIPKEKFIQGEDEKGKFIGMAIPHNPNGDRVQIMMDLSKKVEREFSQIAFNSKWDLKVENGEEKYLFYY